MRTLLGLALLALAGFLIWHGISTDEQARAEFKKQTAAVEKAPPDFTNLQRLYPYSNPAIDARELVLESQVKKQEAAAGAAKVPGKDELKSLALEIPDRTKRGLSGEQPYVQPDAAAIIGVAGLLLALFLPRTRFRGLAFLGVLLGGAAALAGMLPQDSQIALVRKLGTLKYVISSFPRVAQACLALAAITLATPVGRRAPRSSS
jgi:hypothetical protein